MKAKEFIKLKIRKEGYHFAMDSLLELQNEVKTLISTNRIHYKLQDCYDDKRRILESLIKLLEREYEAPIIVDFDGSSTEGRRIENSTNSDIHDSEDDDQNKKH